MGISASRARLSLLLGVSFALVACGGGDDGPAPTANEPAPAPGTGSPPPVAGSPPPPSAGSPPPSSPSVENSPPTIHGTPPPVVAQNKLYSFEPEAEDKDGDILYFSVENAPHWAEFETMTGRLEGTPSPGDIGTYEDIRISVTDGADDAELEPFSITVTAYGSGAVELTWEAPTENVDGTPLTDLAGYKIYWGIQPNKLKNSVKIDNPAVVTYVLENLVPATYYFSATAVNAEGSESDPSGVTSLTIS
jgi:hypothetical protein